jgi:methylenetetrahydrofolate dehydrogenase (NADP+)/methenyltetrahydrofolate cyclohydrolase
MVQIVDGVKIAAKIEAELKERALRIIHSGVTPCLGIIVFDDDKAGQVYSRLKAEAAGRLGIKIVRSNKDSVLDQWNRDDSIHGIMIQRPGYRGPEFEKYWQELVVKIAPKKDVDGLRQDSVFVPATVRAVELILKTVAAQGNTLIIGRGMIGRALGKRLGAKNISSHDDNLTAEILKADILICASGRPRSIKSVKPGATVIDIGWPKGDVDLEAVKDSASAVTPVPGGVGPVTVVSLLDNLLQAV